MCVVNFCIILSASFFLTSFSHLACFLCLVNFLQIVCSRLKNEAYKGTQMVFAK